MLKIVLESGEKAITMDQLLRNLLTENGLSLKKLVSITADNTSANFGGKARRGRNNLYHLLRQGFY